MSIRHALVSVLDCRLSIRAKSQIHTKINANQEPATQKIRQVSAYLPAILAAYNSEPGQPFDVYCPICQNVLDISTTMPSHITSYLSSGQQSPSRRIFYDTRQIEQTAALMCGHVIRYESRDQVEREKVNWWYDGLREVLQRRLMSGDSEDEMWSVCKQKNEMVYEIHCGYQNLLHTGKIRQEALDRIGVFWLDRNDVGEAYTTSSWKKRRRKSAGV